MLAIHKNITILLYHLNSTFRVYFSGFIQMVKNENTKKNYYIFFIILWKHQLKQSCWLGFPLYNHTRVVLALRLAFFYSESNQPIYYYATAFCSVPNISFVLNFHFTFENLSGLKRPDIGEGDYKLPTKKKKDNLNNTFPVFFRGCYTG